MRVDTHSRRTRTGRPAAHERGRVKPHSPVLHVLFWTCCALAASPLAGFASEPAGILATMGELDFTDQLLQHKMERLPAGTRERYESEEGRAELLLELLRIEVFSREAAAAGMDREEAFKARIADITQALLAQEYVRRTILSKASVDPQEAQEYYRRASDAFKIPEKIKVSTLFLPVARDAPQASWDEVRKRAESALDRIKAGDAFTEVAQAFSARPPQEDAEYFARGRLVPEIEETVFALQTGDVSPVLRVEGGFLIFRLEDRVPESTPPFESIGDAVIKKLFEAKQQALFNEEEQRLFAKYGVVIHDPHGQENSTPVGTESTLQGRIVKVQGTGDALRSSPIGSIVIETQGPPGTAPEQVVIRITERTAVHAQTSAGLKAAAFADLQAGQLVRVQTARAAMSYPPQVEASRISILEPVQK